jgi:histidine ammonia-lyase
VIELDVGLTLADVNAVMAGERDVRLSSSARQRVAANRAYVEALVDQGRSVYGVTTGFGRFATTAIPRDKVEELQHNLLRSHAVGVGEPVEADRVRAMLLLRAQSLAVGASGVRPELIDALLALLNADLVPVVPSKGSVGASGDLAPLAHLALPLIGEGEAAFEGTVLDGATALARAGLTPIALAAKEGLALINGTQFMAANLVSAIARAERLMRVADVAAAMSVEGLLGSHKPFHEAVARLRPHAGAVLVAGNLRGLLAGSEIVESHADCGRVQDAYSLRAVPQVHGASRDALAHVRTIVEVELRSVTDNPLILAEADEVVSAGNFHGQPLALVADYAAIAMAELANISERRIEQLVNPALSGLPAFLTPHGGLNSGLMVAQYTAAALVSENKVLAHPASVDSIPTSANQEDHVSMGAHASRKLHTVLDNLAYVLSIELLAGAQAIDFRAPLKPARGVTAAHAHVRTLVAELAGDRYLKPDIEALHGAVAGGSLLAAVEAATGALA